MNEYKVQCNKRKEQLNTKDPKLDIEPSKKGKRKKKKNVKIICIPTSHNKYVKESSTFGKYETVEDAQKALQFKLLDKYYTEYYTFKIIEE